MPSSRTLKRLIQENYFYFFSAALMLLGSYMLMRGKDVNVEPFLPTLKTLLILQGYEIVVIATALIIVRRLKILDDAFNLLLIEIVLLLDPTFFSNSFATMRSVESTWVNIICFALVPIKMLILQRGLHLRLSPRGWIAFLVAAAFAFLAEGPLTKEQPLGIFDASQYHYILAWGILLFVVVLPPLDSLVTVMSTKEGYVSDVRRRRLNGAFLLIPALVIFAHLVETSKVHEIPFYACNFSPFALAFAVFAIKNLKKPDPQQFVFAIDALMAVKLLLCVRLPNSTSVQAKGAAYTSHAVAPPPVPAFIENHIPLILCALAVIGIYLYFHRRFKYKPALGRVALIVGIGVICVLWRATSLVEYLKMFFGRTVELLGWVMGWIGTGLSKAIPPFTAAADWIGEHPVSILYVAWIGLAALVCKFRTHAAWFTFGLLSIWMLSGYPPGPRTDLIPEIIQAFFLLFLVLDHKFSPKPSPMARYITGLIIVSICFGRFVHDPAIWKATILAAEFLLLVGAGMVSRDLDRRRRERARLLRTPAPALVQNPSPGAPGLPVC